MNLSKFDGVAKAPRTERSGSLLTARELCFELSMGTLQLALAGRPITIDSIKEARPLLALTYTKRYSTVPSYLGQGRSNDGLGLWRIGRNGPRSASRENAVLALRWLDQNGHDLGKVAAELGRESAEALLQAVEALKPHSDFEVKRE